MPVLDEIKFMRSEMAAISNTRFYMEPSEYIETVRYLPPELSPHPGYYKYDYTPYLREIVNHLSPMSPTRKIVFKKPAQIGATVGILEAAIAYFIACAPTSVLYVSADKELVKKGMKVKVEQMLDSCGLRDKLFAQSARGNNRATGDTATEKEFPGGFLHAIGAMSAAALRQMSYVVMLMDELNGFPLKLGNEGDPVSIAENRTNAFAEKRKILYLSTPTVLQISKINSLYLVGDQRNWNIPCPRCGQDIVMQWHIQGEDGKPAGIIFEVEGAKQILIPESVRYRCQKCGGEIWEKEKADYMPEGKWVPTQKTQEEGLVSYWLDGVYSPQGMYSWKNMAYDWLKCWDMEKGKVKDIEKYRSFRNTKQGLDFEEQGESLKIEKVLVHRRANYTRNEIKNKEWEQETGSGALMITCAVDVQKANNELLYDIKAWCNNAANYTLEFSNFKAEKDVTDINDPCWRKLENLIENRIWTADDKKQYRIGITFIDARWGESTDTVYQFCRQYTSGVHPIFGEQTFKKNHGLTYMPVSKVVREKAGCACFRINTVKMKDRISRILNTSWYPEEKQPMFYMNFPADISGEILNQFTSEHKVPLYDAKTNQFKGFEWRLMQGRDNHAFDTAVYQFAAIEMVADNTCREILGKEALSWPHFWEYKINQLKENH
jgi:phage terminase large subunit GpA-like protein